MTESAAGERSSSRRIARNTVFRSAGDVVAKLGSIAFFVAMARELGQEGFGAFSFALALSSVLMLVSGFGMESLIVREVARDRSRVHHYLSNVVAIKVITSIALLLVAVGISAVSGHEQQQQVTILLVGGGVAVENLGRTLYSVFQAYERMGFISIALIVQRTVTAAAGIAVLVAGGGLIGASVAFLGGAVLGAATSVWALRRFVVVPRWEWDRAQWLPLMRTAAPIGVATLFFVVLVKLDVTILGLLKPSAEVGVFSAALRLVEATMFISWAFGGALMPWVAQQQPGSERLRRGFELSLKALSAMLLPISVGLVVLAAPVIHLFYGDGYDASVFPLQMLGITAVLWGINELGAYALIARDRPGDITRVVVVVTAVNIALNLALIPPHGADGAAVSAASSAALLAVLATWRTARVVGPINVLRAFAGPAAGAAAMAAAILATELPLVPAAAVGLIAYLAGLAAVERTAFAPDFRSAVEMLRRRRSVQPPLPSEL